MKETQNGTPFNNNRHLIISCFNIHIRVQSHNHNLAKIQDNNMFKMLPISYKDLLFLLSGVGI